MEENNLKFGKYIGSHQDGDYIATTKDDGGVDLAIVYETHGKQGTTNPTITLSQGQWDKLVAWVEWQRKKDLK